MDSEQPNVREWNWEHPGELSPPNFGKLQRIDITPPYTREHLTSLGLTGVQFAEWKSLHPGCLDTDIVGLVDDSGVSTEPGVIYQLGGDSYFIQLDARAPLPFADGCLSWAYAEHFIEHISLADGIRWLGELRRILQPGSLVRLTTPDLRSYVDSYLSADAGMFARHREVMWQRGARPRMPDRRAFMMNLVFYAWEHRWIYDFEELRYAFEEAGYPVSQVQRREFQVGADPAVSAMDLAHRRHETMYVEAYTP